MKRLLAFSAIAFITLPMVMSGQQAPSNGTAVGFPMGGHFIGSGIESVQTQNGNLHVEIPIRSSSGRGVGTSSAFVYDSKGWQITETCSSIPSETCFHTVVPELNNTMQLALSNSNNYVLSGGASAIHQICHDDTTYYTLGSGYVIREPNGTKHHFVPDPIVVNAATDNPCWSRPEDAVRYADDGSGWMWAPGSSVPVTKAGDLPGNYDTNGNSLTITSDPSGNNVVTTDTLGRKVSTDGSYYDSTGALRSLQVTTETVTISTHMCNGLPLCTEYTDTWTEPHTITLPDGLKYTIEYVQNDEGQISSITLPTGATISYTYEPAPLEDYGGKRIQTRSISMGGTTIGSWSYSYTNWSNGTGERTTTITQPEPNNLSDKTVYTFTNTYTSLYTQTANPPVQEFPLDSPVGISKEQYYDTAGNLVKTVDIDLNPSHGIYALYTMPGAINTTWAATNQVSRVEMDYDWKTITLFPDGSYGPATAPITWGNIVEKREYDYGAGAPGPLLKRTHYTYLHTDTTVNPNPHQAAYLAANIANRPTSEIVYDGSGNVISQTKYYYDETAVTSTSSAPAVGHNYTNYGSTNNLRGNLTRVSRWNNQTNTWYDTTYTYDDLGNRLTVTDPGNGSTRHTTTYNYDDSFSGASCNTTSSPTYAFATTITAPSPFGFQSKNIFYQCTSLLQSSRDQNDLNSSRNGTVYAYDLLNRLVSQTDSDGGNTVTSYGGTAANNYQDPLPLTITKTQKIDSTKSHKDVTITDGLGRVTQTQELNPEGTIYVDTTYDPLSRVYTVSNPHFSSTSPTDGLTQYGYDLFGRTTSVLHPGGASLTTTYTGSATMTKDEGNGTQQIERVLDHDGLGRLTSVCEVSSSTLLGSTGNSASACGQAIAATGFLTSYQYTYDSSGYSYQTVVQSGLTNRKFTYDSLGRLKYSYNPEGGNSSTSDPEAGTTSYTYDPDGLVTTRKRPQANTSATSTARTTTTYQHDALHRLTSTTYDDGYTPGTYSNYDETSLWGRTLANTKGHKTSAIVGSSSLSSSTPIAAETFSYDPMGRVSANDQCTPGVCNASSGSHNSFDYAYDYLGNELSASDGAGHSYTLTTDAAGRLLTASNSLTSGTLLSNISYGPFGMVGANIGAAAQETIGYQNRGWIQSILDTPQSGVPSTATFVVSGAEQSKQVTTPGTQSSASVTITGSGSQKKVYDSSCNCFDWVVDTGSLNLIVDGFTARGYTQANTDTSANVATSLAASLNSSSSPVTATVSGSTVTFTSKAATAAANYTLTTSSTINNPSDFTSLSFSFSSLTGAMSGGQNGNTTTVYDTGTAGLSANGHTTSVPLSSSSTSVNVASALVSAINADSGAAVTAASPSSGQIVLTSKTGGTAGDYGYSFTGTPSSGFSNPSFGASPSSGTLSSPQHLYSATVGHAPNGDVTSSTDSVNGTWGYGYDEFNRLTSATIGGMSLHWGYDRYGNRWTQSATGTGSTTVLQPSYSFNSSNNRIDTPGGNQVYDAAGNMTRTPDSLINSFYDAEGRVCSVGGTSCATGSTRYVYDADGLRVAKYTSATLTNQYLYNLGSQMISELDGTGKWIRGEMYANGTYIGTYDNTSGTLATTFAFGDWLGTIRYRTDAKGNGTESVTSEPFGDGMAVNGGESSHKHFTGKLHDDETGLDYFGARYYYSNMGRFMSPDWADNPEAVPYGHFETPQSLNLYAYVKNNPITDTDPDGHDGGATGDSAEAANTYKVGDASALSDGTLPRSSSSNPEEMSGEATANEMLLSWGNGQTGPAGDNTINKAQQQGTTPGSTQRPLISVSGTEKLALGPLVAHYLKGDGTAYTLSTDEFNKFVAEMQKDGRLNGALTPVPGMPDGVYQQQVNTYGTSYALAVGSTTVYYLGGKPAGYRDYWDFDSKPWGQRPVKAEMETRAAGGVMNAVDGQPFWVEYGIHPH